MQSARGTLTMTRNGEFEVRTYGDKHCGTAKWQQIRYTMIVTCSVSLDERGFLFDQLNVQDYFANLRSTDWSCEELVIVCAQALYARIMKENPQCKVLSMKLTLSPAPYLASMSFEWDRKRDGIKPKKKPKPRELESKS